MANQSKKHKKVDIPEKPNWYDKSLPPEQVVTLTWRSQNNNWWNDACADVLEVFGLPGNRFYYKPHFDHMTFTFKSKKDADLCKILLSDKISN